MKKIYTLLALALMGLTPLALTSCVFNDDDDYVANSLQGIWRGQIQSEYYYGRYGHDVQYTDTQLEFYSDPYSYARGLGREIDFSYSYYGEEVRFSYTVNNHVIYMDYSDGSQVAICNWNLSGNTFTGDFYAVYRDYMTGYYEVGDYLASFRLYRVSDGWDSSFYGYGWYNDWRTSQHKDLFPDEEDD